MKNIKIWNSYNYSREKFDQFFSSILVDYFNFLPYFSYPVTNLGDALNLFIIKALSGRRVVNCYKNKNINRRLFAIGTILNHAKDDDIVWGSGIEDIYKLNFKNLKINAVRGPLTRKYLVSNNINCPETYGDPAILLPFLFKLKVKKKYKIGYVPHINDNSRIKGRVISVKQNPLNAIKEINECEIIISSSLHGIIIAESYGIPACWALPESNLWKNNKTNHSFKYNDYYLSTLRNPICYKYDKIDENRDCSIALNIPKAIHNHEKLLLSFPFLREEIKTIADLEKYKINGIKFLK